MLADEIFSRVREDDLDQFRIRVNANERAYEDLFINVTSETVNEMMERRLGQEGMTFEIKGEPIDTAAGKTTMDDQSQTPAHIEEKRKEGVRSSEAVFKNFLDQIRG